MRLKAGTDLSFEAYPFLQEILRQARYPEPLAVMKSAQCGGTTTVLFEALFHASERGRSVIYYMPTGVTVGPVVREKVDPMVMASPYLRSRVMDRHHRSRVENVGMKSVGPGWLYLRGAKSKLAREATPADVCILDERDWFEEGWIDDIRQRLNDSKFKGWRELGKPTFVGNPIHTLYEESDHRVWMVRCPHCDGIDSLDWFRDVVVDEGGGDWSLRDTSWVRGERDIHIYCPSCGKPRDRLAGGEWVAKHPGRVARGFNVNRLMTYSTTITELWELFKDVHVKGNQIKIQAVYNGDLGLPFTPESAGLSDTLLDKARRNYLMPDCLGEDDEATGGFDVQGDYLAGRISQIIRRGGRRIRRAVWIGRVTWDGFDDLMARYRPRRVVIDGAYDPTKAKEARARHKGNPTQIWLAYYPGRQDNPDKDMIVPDLQERSLDVQRTQSLDRSHSELLTGANVLPRNARSIPDYYAEMKAAIRVEEESAGGGFKRLVWRKTMGPDDFRHADNYDFLAAEILDRAWGDAGPPAAGASKRKAAMDKVRPKAEAKGPSAEDWQAILAGDDPKKRAKVLRERPGRRRR